MANEQTKGAGSPVTLRDRYLIYGASPLTELNTGSAQAFLVEDRRDAARPLFALIVRPGFPPRINAMRVLKGMANPGLMMLVEWGVIDWPPANRKVMAVVYERPLGGRVATSLSADFKRVEELDVVRKVMTPLAAALREMRAHGMTHRAIRPTNMFWATAERDRIVLGDCTTAPPGFEQPLLLEPIEMGMAQPAGRGSGDYAVDYYALGASLVLLLQGRNPLPGADDDTILRNKILQGSYSVLVGDARLPLPTIEALRGLLCDDPQDRWNGESVELWLSGRRLSPLLTKLEKRGSRAFPFNNKEYNSARELAIAFSRNWDAAISVVIDGRLELWLRRSLDQKEKANAIAGVVRQAAQNAADKKPASDIMMAKVCMILDPAAPIRYKGLSVMPSGIGTCLAMIMVEGGDVRIIAEALMREVVKAWLETRDTYDPENSMMEGNFRELKVYLDRGTIGNGIERVLYVANESMPCISPFTVEDYVLEIRDLLPAINSLAKKGDGKGWPIDRHVAAFIGARTQFDIERQMLEIAEPNPERAAMGMLNLLAVIQWRMGQGNLYGLCGWVGGLMQPAINAYRSRDRRRELEKEIPRVVREGSLVEMARLLDNAEEKYNDAQEFEQARADWADARREIRDIEAGKIDRDDGAIRTARQVAALISVTISLITVTLLIIAKVL
ncbi:MAG TPA: hypothetical protein VK558_09345 [Patescibacteria group bacterium]|nr:hypothetical protein [Patescibacteria group bacterium]